MKNSDFDNEVKKRVLVSFERDLWFILKPFGEAYYELPYKKRYSFWQGVGFFLILSASLMILAFYFSLYSFSPYIASTGIALIFWWYMKWYKYCKEKN